MSSNTDNAMTRFLFAILRQKNLKDIDWNKVAHDPILAQEITNGHAARMRYSRFRSAMLGLEPTRRNRTGPPKSRVTKSKKEAKPKKDGGVKSESAAASPAPQQPSETSAPKVKQKSAQHCLESRLTPGLTPGPMPAPAPTVPTPHTMQPRLLTPCSDTDVFASALAASPTSDMVHSQNTFDFPGAPCHPHDDASWHPAMPYTPFPHPYAFDDFGSGACDHQHLHHLHHQHDHFGLPNPSIDAEGDHINVKHEEWDHCV
ncbi:hypothetical protein DL769_000229 [Monosporascus sp. CRB-8-3]|nr:hypothetical protein DL769_000229 [Monosporascus sp. CRB-8-3]